MIPAIHSDIIAEVPVSPMWQPQSKDTFQYDTGTYVHQAVLPNLKIDPGLMSATLARPVRPCFTQSHSLFHHSLPHVFHIPQGPYYLAQKLVPTDVSACLHVLAEICTPLLASLLIPVISNPPAGNRVSALR